MAVASLQFFIAALAMSSLLGGCGGGQDEPGTLDLGGGLSMAADGTILGATPVAVVGP
ncbi:MAG: hypothetical protein ACJ8GO_06955 [Ramlibacter sp.]